MSFIVLKTLNQLTLIFLIFSPNKSKQHDACARAAQAGGALASLGRAMVRDVDESVSFVFSGRREEEQRTRKRPEEKKLTFFLRRK